MALGIVSWQRVYGGCREKFVLVLCSIFAVYIHMLNNLYACIVECVFVLMFQEVPLFFVWDAAICLIFA